MKTGKSLTELAQTLEDIRANGKDYLVPAAKLMMDDESNLVFTNGSLQRLQPTDHAHGQVASYSGVPKLYYDRLKAEKPELLALNVNHGIAKAAGELNRGKAETRMVRTWGGKVRGFVSSSYRRLDSYDLAQTVLPILADERMEVVSSEITDTRMYLKALTPKMQVEVRPGDVVQYGLVISNSDVGAGSVRVEPLIYRLVCANGLISNTAVRKSHVGKNLGLGDEVMEILSDEAVAQTDKAFWLQVRDVVLDSMRPERFDREVNRIREAIGAKITNFDIPDVVELSMKAAGVGGEGVKDTIIAYLANGADGAGLTKWGLANGFTYAAHKSVTSYDASIELERAGSKILDLDPRQWRRISEKQ